MKFLKGILALTFMVVIVSSSVIQYHHHSLCQELCVFSCCEHHHENSHHDHNDLSTLGHREHEDGHDENCSLHLSIVEKTQQLSLEKHTKYAHFQLFDLTATGADNCLCNISLNSHNLAEMWRMPYLPCPTILHDPLRGPPQC